MLDLARSRPALAWLAIAVGLAGCTTPHVTPKMSEAVLEARARRGAPAAPACPDTPLSALSPITVGFAFNDTELAEAMSRPLAGPAQWLGCHPATPVFVKPDADGHGGPAEQDALAQRRAEAVRTYLAAHGVAANRVRILRRGAADPSGEVFLIRAEGRRW